MPAPRTRRTQAERRESTTRKLLDATVVCLAELGYAKTSVSAICAGAEVSQGALFRHFPTRRDIIVAAADAIAHHHVEMFNAATVGIVKDHYRDIVLLMRSLCRSPTQAAWREIMIAARTDSQLCDAARDGLERFELMLIDMSAQVLELDASQAKRAAVVLLSVMHMFDSEAVTAVVYGNESLEAQRVDWAAQMLERELAALTRR